MMQPPKSVLPLSEDYGRSTERAILSPAVPGTESAPDSAGLSTRNADIRLNEDLTLGETDFDCIVRRILSVHWRSGRSCMNGMTYEVR